MSISGKEWCKLWHSSHNEILTPLSWCRISGYFKNHWGLKLFLKCHRRSQNVYFFYLGPIISLNIQVYSSEAVARSCSVKKGVLANFTKFTGKHLNQSLFFNKVAGQGLDALILRNSFHSRMICPMWLMVTRRNLWQSIPMN